VLIEHPLQPFDPRNFTPGALVDGVWGFDQHMLDGANALTAGVTAVPDGEFLPWTPPETIDLEELRAFLEHPVRSFVQARLGVRFSDRDELRDDRLPVELNSLDQWRVGHTLLLDGLEGIDRTASVEALTARGELPVGTLAHNLVDGVSAEVDAIIEAAQQAGVRRSVPEAVHVDVDLPSGHRLTGLVAAVTDLGIERVVFSRPAPKRVLPVWLDLLAASAMRPDRRLEAVIVARDKRGPEVTRWVAPSDPVECLDILVDLYLRGMSEPLPLFCETSYEFATGSRWVSGAWEGNRQRSGEANDDHHRLAFGRALEFDELAEFPCGPTSRGTAGRTARTASRCWPVGCGIRSWRRS
jgi:exodeoxyribonuclease V gamma subunit